MSHTLPLLELSISRQPHIFSSEGIEGNSFFRYQDEIVDCVKPDSVASWYSDQPF